MKYIDCDSHILPHRVYQYVDPKYQSALPQFHFDNDGRLTDVAVGVDPIKQTLNPNPFNSHNRVSGISNVAKRIQDLDKMGWTQQLLCPQELALRFNYTVEPNLAAEMCSSYNRVVAEILNDHSDLFFGVALIPLQNYQASIKELQFAIDNNFRGIYLDTMYLESKDAVSRPIESLEYLGDLYYTCQERGIVVYRHHMMHHTHFRRHPWFQPFGHFLPHDIELSMYSAINTGTFEQYPQLQMVFAEDAEPYAVRAISNLREHWAKNNKNNAPDPMIYWNRNISITLDIEMAEARDWLLRELGSERLLLSSDYPHDDSAGKNKWKDINDFNMLKLSVTDRENLAFRNAEKLFRL